MPAPISKQTLQAFVFDSGIDVASVFVDAPDDLYSLPSEAWIRSDFAEELRAELFSLGIRPSSTKWNCNKFSRFAAGLAAECQAETLSEFESALAFAQYRYVKDDGNGHSINAAVCRSENGLYWIFFEPQTQQIVNLSDKERTTQCSNILF